MQWQIVVDDTRLRAGSLSALFTGHPSRSLITVGITGTNGKTTSARLLARMVREAGRHVGNTSITVAVEVYAQRNPKELITVKVTEASLTYVAVNATGRPRQVPAEHRAPGTWMHDALDVRDDWESRMLRTADWSPLF